MDKCECGEEFNTDCLGAIVCPVCEPCLCCLDVNEEDSLDGDELDEKLEEIRAELVADGLCGEMLERAIADWCRHLS
jgi:hypothetical protein